MLVSINNLSKFYGATQILNNINLTIDDNDRIGLIGANGAGKSTLLNIIEGTLDFEEGTKDLGTDLTMGFLKQNSGLDVNNTIWQELKSVFSEVNEVIEKMRKLEDEMSQMSSNTSEAYHKLLNKYTEYQSFIDAKDGYNIDLKI